MARRFVRVDLSDVARDFRPVAIEPGLPVLDKASANGRLLFKWLGRLGAEPEWDGESVHFFVQDDHGGRLEEVVGQPASDEDLQELLTEDLALLRERLAKAKAESSSERLVLKRIREDFAALADDPHRLDRDSYFFRYRDQQHRWRLVWCPGYQRREAEAAPAVICTDPDCNLLFVRRPGGSARCPGCHTSLLARAAPKGKRWRWAALVLLLLAVLAAFWLMRSPRMTVSPERLELTVGQTAELRIDATSWKTPDIAVADPDVADAGERHVRVTGSFPFFGSQSVTQAIRGRAAGKTMVEVRLGSLSRSVEVRVKPEAIAQVAANSPPPKASAKTSDATKPAVLPAPLANEHGKPSEVAILSDQGQSVRFPVGAEFRDFRVEARYPDGFTRIVTKIADLRTPDKPAEAPVSFAHGKMRGVRPGKTTVQAEFDGVVAKQGLGVEVTAAATIDEIRVSPSPATILPGEIIPLDAEGYQGGKSVGAVNRLPGLKWKSSDTGIVRLDGRAAIGVRTGQATVTAQLRSITSRPAQITVAESIAEGLKADPSLLRILVGERLVVGEGVNVLRGNVDVSRQCAITPSATNIVRYDVATHSLVGVSPGVCSVRFERGGKRTDAFIEVVAAPAVASEDVRVTPGPRVVITHPERTTILTVPTRERLWIEPSRATLSVGETTPRFALMAQSPGGTPREIPAAIESTNPRILAPVRDRPGQFAARQMGSTQVRAAAGSRVVYADVTVTGARFDAIRTSIASPTDTDFGVRAEITAAGAQGALEYRVYRAGQPPSGAWVAAKVEGDHRRVVLESPRIPIGPPSAFYSLTFEAREPATGTVQQYPFTFRLAPQIERAEGSKQ